MGNSFSKTNKVAPLSSGHNLPKRQQTASVRSTIWYRKLFCCSSNAVTVLHTSMDTKRDGTVGEGDGTVGEGDGQSSSDSELARDSSLELHASDNEDESVCSSCDLQSSFPMRLELAADRTPLPMIEDSCKLIRSGLTVKRNYEGKTSAIAFDVEVVEEDEDIPNRPQSSLSMGNPTCLPRRLRDRLPALPTISQETIQRRVSEAAERKNVLMRDRSERIHQRHALSKEMLERLEAEKQRLLREKLQEKERQAELRKESLKQRNDAKVVENERRIERTRARALENERQECSTAAEAFESKMRAAEHKKMAMKEKQERKNNAFRYKQIQARLKCEEMADGDDDDDDGAGDEKRREFKVWLHLFSKDRREERRRLMEKEKQKKLEESIEDEDFFEEPEKLETYEDDSVDQYKDLCGEEEIVEEEEDPFWKCQ